LNPTGRGPAGAGGAGDTSSAIAANPRPAPSSRNQTTKLCGDAFRAGELRQQELPGAVQRRGSFVEHRVKILEDVRHPRCDVEGDPDVGGGSLPGEADRVVE
jgi:hypothetical protein